MRNSAPAWRSIVTRQLVARRLDPTLHRSVIEELSQHLDERYRSLIARGMPAADAERNVIDELDDEALGRELSRAERTAPTPAPALGETSRSGVIDRIVQDVRYAARALRKSPGFTAVAVLTLALGVGANTAIFSIVNAVLLRPLPYAQSDRLVRIYESNVERGWPTFSTSQPNFLDFRAQSRTFEGMAAIAGASFTMTTNQGAEIVRGNRVSADFLPVLGVAPVLGRNFLADEDRADANAQVVMLTDGFWRRRFGADASILGQPIAVDGTSYIVIGILPSSFRWGTADFLIPLAANPKESRGDHQLTAIGRLRQGATIDQAHSDLAAIAATLGERYPESNKGWSVRLVSFYDWLIPEPTRESLKVLFGAVGVLLLIACANVASLLLGRGAARRKELSIRVALGGARSRVIRQLLMESLLLALVAGVAGLAVGAATTRLLVAYGPTSVPRLDEAGLDVTVMTFGLVVSIAAVLFFGLIPAIQVSRQQPSETLREGTRGTSGGPARQGLRSALTVAEVALSIALLIGAGLLFRSFWQLQQVDPGFNLTNLTTARIALPDGKYNARTRVDFFNRLLSEMKALPGIVSVATSSAIPLSGGNTSTEVHVPGMETHDGARPSASWRLVSPDYFATMGIPLRGRDFSPHDVAEARSTIIISESMARAYWPTQDALGRTITPSSLGNRERTIIGIAGDVHALGLDADPPRTVYYSTTQLSLGGTQLVWRSAGEPAAHIATVRDVVRRIDPSVPLYDVRLVSDLVSNSVGPRRFNMYLLGVFAAVAILLAAIGLFGVMAYLVSQRTREIGVRLALGAHRADLFRLVIGRGLVLASLGAVLGLAAAFWLTRLMESLLFSVSTSDPITFAAVPVAMVLVALLACYVPARRAMRVDPVIALRAE